MILIRWPNMKTLTYIYALLMVTCTISANAIVPPVKVFILAGQSNMQGQAVVDLDHPQYYNGGRGTLNHVMKHTKTPERYQHLKTKDGKWTVRDDVWVSYQTRPDKLKAGKLSIGYAGYDGKHHFGPELQIGHILGEHYKEQVLLIKTAWGGKSLFKDFRPPSAGGQTGPYYTQMINEVNQTLKSLDKRFPEYQNQGFEIAGFIWFQGWNDMFDKNAYTEYEQNLVHLIHDVRKAFKKPALPVVIGETGNAGRMEVRLAQAAVAKRPEFKGTVSFVKTAHFLRKPEDSPNKGHGHHWFGNAESYFLAGDAMGQAMKKLIIRQSAKK